MAFTTKVFKNGGSNAIRVPKEFCTEGEEMLVRKIGHAIMLIPKEKAWKMFEEALGKADADFLPERGNRKTKASRKRS